MRYRIKIVIKDSNVIYTPQWKRFWITSWNNEVFVGRDGYMDIIHAYNDIKRWQSQEEIFSKTKLKSVRYIHLS
jgi:hypothetical protein